VFANATVTAKDQYDNLITGGGATCEVVRACLPLCMCRHVPVTAAGLRRFGGRSERAGLLHRFSQRNLRGRLQRHRCRRIRAPNPARPNPYRPRLDVVPLPIPFFFPSISISFIYPLPIPGVVNNEERGLMWPCLVLLATDPFVSKFNPRHRPFCF
jgi:hypothetical protein